MKDRVIIKVRDGLDRMKIMIHHQMLATQNSHSMYPSRDMIYIETIRALYGNIWYPISLAIKRRKAPRCSQKVWDSFREKGFDCMEIARKSSVRFLLVIPLWQSVVGPFNRKFTFLWEKQRAQS